MRRADLAETVEVLCHQMFYRAGGVAEAGSKQGGRGGPALAGPAVRCSGCPFMGQSTNESGVLGPLWNIRGHSTPPDPHPPSTQECHKALRDPPSLSLFTSASLFTPLSRPLIDWFSFVVSVFRWLLRCRLHFAGVPQDGSNKLLLDR